MRFVLPTTFKPFGFYYRRLLHRRCPERSLGKYSAGRRTDPSGLDRDENYLRLQQVLSYDNFLFHDSAIQAIFHTTFRPSRRSGGRASTRVVPAGPHADAARLSRLTFKPRAS